MNRLRDALGDSAENPRFIQTIPRRGYRFIAPVQRLVAPLPPLSTDEAPAPASPGAGPSPVAPALATATPATRARRVWAWAAVGAAVVLAAATALIVTGTVDRWRGTARAGRWMIAVLPFQNLSGSPDQDYFSDGFTDELIGQLGGSIRMPWGSLPERPWPATAMAGRAWKKSAGP